MMDCTESSKRLIITIDINGCNNTASIDCLKPIHLDTDNFPPHLTNYTLNHLTMSNHLLLSTCPLPSVSVNHVVIIFFSGSLFSHVYNSNTTSDL